MTARASVGFTKQDHSADDMEAINRMFAPEFRNRLDGVVRFQGLSEATIAHVVDKFVMELESQLEAKNVTIEVDDGARSWRSERTGRASGRASWGEWGLYTGGAG